jgi:hypothetical protein
MSNTHLPPLNQILIFCMLAARQPGKMTIEIGIFMHSKASWGKEESKTVLQKLGTLLELV